MWKLTIEDDEGKRTPLPLVRDEYTIGRGEENTVRLTERNISRRHATLRLEPESGWVIVDTSSRNGSYVNGVRLVGEHFVSEGDIVQVGDYRLAFSDEELAAATTDPTKASTIPGGGNAAVKPDRLVVVVGPDPGQEFVIQTAVVSIGRAPELDLSIAHASVSRVHAEIHALGGGRYEIIDKASANGVRVNGSLLKRGLLEAGDFIELGEVKLKFVGAGQLYRPGSDAIRLEPVIDEVEHQTVRPPPAAGVVFGTTSSIDQLMGDAAGRSRFAKNLMLGAGVGLVVVAGLFALQRAKGSGGMPGAGVATGSATQAQPTPLDPVRAVLEEAKELAAQGDLDLAHNRIVNGLPSSSSLRDGAEAREIEGKWADSVLARADQESDVAAKRQLLNSVAQATTVDRDRRRSAADKLKEVDYLGTDIHELPKANKPQAPAAAAPAPAPAEPPPARPAAPQAPRPVLAADPWSTPPAHGNDSSNSRASDMALEGRDGEARARAQLEPKVWNGRATPEEIRMLRAICKHMGDRPCSDRAAALLNNTK
ncbi:MAG: FHA domain-containing protein [Polyangiaceae bacterium]